MLHSKFGRESLPQKKKSSVKKYIFLLLFLFSLVGVFWAFKNQQRILFHLKKDNYVAIIHSIEDYEKSLKDNHESNSSQLDSVGELLTKLIKDNPSDSYLYYLIGKLYTIECTSPVFNNPDRLTDIFFLDYIKRYQIPASFPYNHWEQAIAYTRKAILLGLPEGEVSNAVINLVSLYIVGGTPYWNSARDYLASENLKNNPLIQNIYKLLLVDNTPPDETFIAKTFGLETTTYWMGLYYLKVKNYPLAFYNFKKLLLSESTYLRNNAYYIMGHIMGEQKDMSLKLYYHSLIDFDEFLKRNPWFLDEHNYTLRYLGQNDLAKKFLTQYEKLVLELKESI
jgi:tetratricopeptide (TPR) repeat protein